MNVTELLKFVQAPLVNFDYICCDMIKKKDAN